MITPVSLEIYLLPGGYWMCKLCVLLVKLPIGTPCSIKYFTENLTDLRRKIFMSSRYRLIIFPSYSFLHSLFIYLFISLFIDLLIFMYLSLIYRFISLFIDLLIFMYLSLIYRFISLFIDLLIFLYLSLIYRFISLFLEVTIELLVAQSMQDT